MIWLRHLMNLLPNIRANHITRSTEPPSITNIIVANLNHMVDTIIQNPIDFTRLVNTIMKITPTQMLLILMMSFHALAAQNPLQKRKMVKILLK